MGAIWKTDGIGVKAVIKHYVDNNDQERYEIKTGLVHTRKDLITQYMCIDNKRVVEWGKFGRLTLNMYIYTVYWL